MNNYFEYLDNLPIIPNELISEVHASILKYPNDFKVSFKTDYRRHAVTEQLKEFVKLSFNNHVIKIQIIENKLEIHRDIGRTVAYNYLIDSGGSNVETCFYEDMTVDIPVYENKTFRLIEKIKIEEHRWHCLNVSNLHNVINLTSPRIAITVTPII